VEVDVEDVALDKEVEEVLPIPDELEDVEVLAVVLAGTLVELCELGIGVDEGGMTVATSTGHTSASMPPMINAVQLLKGALGKPAYARPPQLKKLAGPTSVVFHPSMPLLK
jgi:hypothetical protein